MNTPLRVTIFVIIFALISSVKTGMVDVKQRRLPEPFFVPVFYQDHIHYCENRTIDLSLYLIDSRKNSKFTNIKNINAVYIEESNSKDSITKNPVNIKSITKLYDRRIEINGQYMYPVKFDFEIINPISNNDIMLVFNLVDGIDYVFYPGNIYIDDDVLINQKNEYIAANKLYYVYKKNDENDKGQLKAFIMEINVVKDTTIQSFGSTLLNEKATIWGIDKKRISIIEGDSGKYIDLANKGSLDEVLPNIYDISVLDNPSWNVDIDLKKGKYTIIVPLCRKIGFDLPIYNMSVYITGVGESYYQAFFENRKHYEPINILDMDIKKLHNELKESNFYIENQRNDMGS